MTTGEKIAKAHNLLNRIYAKTHAQGAGLVTAEDMNQICTIPRMLELAAIDILVFEVEIDEDVIELRETIKDLRKYGTLYPDKPTA